MRLLTHYACLCPPCMHAALFNADPGWGFNFVGGNLPLPTSGPNACPPAVAGPEECLLRCYSVKGCVAAAVEPPSSATCPNACWLKSSVDPAMVTVTPTGNQEWIAVRMGAPSFFAWNGVYINGNDIPISSELSAGCGKAMQGPEECAVYCKMQPNCM